MCDKEDAPERVESITFVGRVAVSVRSERDYSSRALSKRCRTCEELFFG